jgi:hypothetical protein
MCKQPSSMNREIRESTSSCIPSRVAWFRSSLSSRKSYRWSSRHFLPFSVKLSLNFSFVSFEDTLLLSASPSGDRRFFLASLVSAAAALLRCCCALLFSSFSSPTRSEERAFLPPSPIDNQQPTTNSRSKNQRSCFQFWITSGSWSQHWAERMLNLTPAPSNNCFWVMATKQEFFIWALSLMKSIGKIDRHQRTPRRWVVWCVQWSWWFIDFYSLAVSCLSLPSLCRFWI